MRSWMRLVPVAFCLVEASCRSTAPQAGTDVKEVHYDDQCTCSARFACDHAAGSVTSTSNQFFADTASCKQDLMKQLDSSKHCVLVPMTFKVAPSTCPANAPDTGIHEKPQFYMYTITSRGIPVDNLNQSLQDAHNSGDLFALAVRSGLKRLGTTAVDSCIAINDSNGGISDHHAFGNIELLTNGPIAVADLKEAMTDALCGQKSDCTVTTSVDQFDLSRLALKAGGQTLVPLDGLSKLDLKSRSCTERIAGYASVKDFTFGRELSQKFSNLSQMKSLHLDVVRNEDGSKTEEPDELTALFVDTSVFE